MEILFVSHKFPPSTGGMEKQSYELVLGMEQKQCKVHRLIYDKKENKILFFLSLSKRIRKICRNNPDISVIHFNDGLIACFCSFFKLRKDIAYVATLHGLDIVFPSAIYHRYIFRRLERYDCLIAVSYAAAERTISLGIDSAKVVVVPNGVDTSANVGGDDDFMAWLGEKGIDPSGKKILLMMGRPVKRKGFSWFSQNVLPLVKENFLLIIAGPFRRKSCMSERFIYALPGNLRNKLMLFLGYASDERDIREVLRNSSNVVHVGRLLSEEINQLFRNIDAFLMPNVAVEGDMEGFGLVCLEASVHNALVFASDIDGIPDAVVHNKNGVVLPPEDVQAWAHKLNDLAENPLSYEQCKENFGQFTKDHYSWKNMVDTYYALFLKMSCQKEKNRT